VTGLQHHNQPSILVEPDDQWDAFQQTADAALVQRVGALEPNNEILPNSKWIRDPRCAGFFKDFHVRITRGLAPNGRVRDVFFQHSTVHEDKQSETPVFHAGNGGFRHHSVWHCVLGALLLRCAVFYCVDSRAEWKSN